MEFLLFSSTASLFFVLVIFDHVTFTARTISEREQELIKRQWKILGTSAFSSRRYGLNQRQGRFHALEYLFKISERAVREVVSPLQLTGKLSDAEHKAPGEVDANDLDFAME